MARSKELSAAFFSFVIWTVHISRVNLWANIILCKYTNVGSIDIKGQKSSKLNLFVLSIYIFFGQKSFEDSNSFNNNNSSVIGTSRLKCLTKIALAKVDTYTNLNFFFFFWSFQKRSWHRFQCFLLSFWGYYKTLYDTLFSSLEI